MTQPRVIDYVPAIDAFDQLKDAGYLLDAIDWFIQDGSDAKKTLEAVSYVFHLYRDELAELMPRLEGILEGESVN